MRTRNTDKQELVKETAISLLAEQGFEGFSMNKLAKACGISVATLYIYYADKDDLIKQIGVEMGREFFGSALKDFKPDMPFAEGLRLQWKNRLNYGTKNHLNVKCWEAIRHSPHNEYVLQNSYGQFKETLTLFRENAIKRGELTEMPFEIFWSIAYGPLYTLMRFQHEKKSLGDRPFKLTPEMTETAFKAVIKALTPNK